MQRRLVALCGCTAASDCVAKNCVTPRRFRSKVRGKNAIVNVNLVAVVVIVGA
jgi:hypothetical protein